jgi:hypothetical protein
MNSVQRRVASYPAFPIESGYFGEYEKTYDGTPCADIVTYSAPHHD